MVNSEELGPPAFILLVGLTLFFFTNATAPNNVLVCAAASEDFSFDTNTVRKIFVLRGVPNNSKSPYVSHGKVYLTQDPTDSVHHRTLYNVGRLMDKNPIPARDKQHQILSFDTYLRFNITTTTEYNKSGDGVAFVMTSDEQIPSNSTGRFLGLMPERPVDRHERFFAVEFDTFQNLQPEIADPSASHIGININNLSSVAHLDTSTESDPLYLYHNYTFNVWIAYNASSHLISVWATNETDTVRPPMAVLTFQHNLSQVFENFTDIYVAITAASGNNSQAAILYNWRFSVSRDDPAHHLHIWYVLVPPVLGFVFLLVLVTAIYVDCRRQKSVMRERNETVAIEMASGGVRCYKYSELMQATRRFSEQSRIGSGGFSTVYRGVLRDNTQVAVKRMRSCGARMEADTIAREVQIISQIRHRNLLPLRGWCYERGEALLVYDYMPRGSLDSYLYGKKRRSGQVMDGETRFKILVGTAAALEYLHGDLPGSCRVLHRDVKAANVLLTDTFDAMLADFGLSRLIADDILLVTTMPAGTPGYVAPEVMQTGRVDAKADVYSFGVLLLEVACGRQALDPSDSQYSRLVDRVWLRHQQKSMLDVLDTQIVYPSHPNLHVGADHPGLQKWQCVLHLGL